MPRKIQPTFTRARAHNIVCQGDSLTDANMLQGAEWTRWTEVLRRRLEAAGAHVNVRNIAQSGARTDDGGITGGTGKQMLNRFTPFIAGVPDIAFIFGGANDYKAVTALTSTGTTGTVNIPAHGLCTTGQSVMGQIFGATPAGYNISGVQFTFVDANNLSYVVPSGMSTPATGTIYFRLDTQRNLQAMVKWLRFGARGAYRSQADLPVDAIDGDRYVVLYDTSSTGGAAALSPNHSATITGAASATDPTVWEFRLNKAGEAGWGRIAVAGTAYDPKVGVNKIILTGMHYLNFSAAGDTLLTPFVPYDNVTGVRTAQIAAAAAESVPYADTYAYFKARIGVTDVQGDHLWHVADSNQHFSEYGHSLMADHIYRVLTAQAGWLTAINS